MPVNQGFFEIINSFLIKKSTAGFCWRWIFCLFSKSVIPIFCVKDPAVGGVLLRFWYNGFFGITAT